MSLLSNCQYSVVSYKFSAFTGLNEIVHARKSLVKPFNLLHSAGKHKRHSFSSACFFYCFSLSLRSTPFSMCTSQVTLKSYSYFIICSFHYFSYLECSGVQILAFNEDGKAGLFICQSHREPTQSHV